MSSDLKFGRQYLLKIETITNEILEIKPPFTIEFVCKRNDLATANTANIKIYNLSEKNRNLIYKDKYETTIYRQLEFRAGYEEDAPKIFKGNIMQCFSYRSGVNVITEIECFDGGDAIANSVSSITIEAGQPNNKTLSVLVNDLKNVQLGQIGDFTGGALRGKVLFGNTSELLKNESNNRFFIDSEKVYILNNNECIEGSIQLITAESGLLESPRRSDTQLVFKILFEPRLRVGQILQLESKINSIFNGIYKVIGFTHTGIISEAVGGKCETEVHLWLGPGQLKVV